MDGHTLEREAAGESGLRPAASPRKRRSDGERSHRAIMDAATRLATERGLDGLAISELAAETGLTKGGLYAHFGSKEQLQLATVDAALEIVAAQVVGPALSLPQPIARLRALCENFLTYAQHTFPGGCFFAAAGSEFDTRTGAVRDRLVEYGTSWMKLLTDVIGDACEAAELDVHGKKPAQLAFELNSFLHLANDAYVLYQDPEQFDYARTAVARLLEQHTPDR
jgi:AcrR family transcriptional regulator